MNCKDTKWKLWVRIFDIPEVSKHETGFTIYKIISILYPESCPDAVTKVSVWKRFNDFKLLYKEMKLLHKKLNMKNEMPNLPKPVLFKRFDLETINHRKQAILSLLEYIGTHSVLFTSKVFVKFFETSYTPAELLSSNINTIRAKLNLPDDNDLSINSDEDKISDTDSMNSSNFSSKVPVVSDCLSKSNTNLRKLNSMTSIDSNSTKSLESCSTFNMDSNLLLTDNHIEGPFNLPSSSQSAIHYLDDASVHINRAVEFENDNKYEEAFNAYKTAVDILITGGQSDTNYDRKKIARYKTEKSLIQAEKIFNMHLAPEVKDLLLQKQTQTERPNIIKGPLFNLYKYKVIKIISASGMLVLHCENQQLYYIKVIHKTVQFLNEHLILPENVPYMVKLINHYICDYALFLVLEYCSGTKLIDFLKNESTELEPKDKPLLSDIQDETDSDSELSFSELISEYVSNREKQKGNSSYKEESDSDSSFEKVEFSDMVSKKPAQNILDEPLDQIKQCCDNLEPKGLSIERKLSEMSSIDSLDVDCKQNISEIQIVKWAAQLVIAIEKLHCLGIICRDLSIENVLLDAENNIVLTYMCNIKELCDLYMKGIDANLAPEVYSFEDVTAAVDWWSFGAILYRLLVGMVNYLWLNYFYHGSVLFFSYEVLF